MPSSREDIIDELLKLDPSLAKNRKKLEQMVTTLEEARPSVPWRPAFKKELLQELHKSMRSNQEVAPSSIFSSLSLMFNRVLMIGGGAVLGALLVAVVMQQPFTAPLSTDGNDEQTPQATVETVSPKAFGSIAQTGEAYGKGGGGGGGGVPSNAAEPYGTDDMRIAYPPENYTQPRYQFDGELTLPTDTVDVYRRIKPDNAPSGNGVMKGFATGLFNWDAFGGLSMQSVQLMQSGNSPYSIYIDYAEGSLSLNRMYYANERPGMNCQTSECFEQNRLREGDMISDERAIEIAKNFATKYGIDLSGYGDPIISDNWQIMYARSADKASFYFPEQINVVFPTMIDGKIVYEEYGQPHGVNVSIDIRSESVASLYNYQFMNLQKSAYAAVTDEAKVRSVIDSGSLYMWDDPNAKKVYSTLGEPTEGFMRYYQWDQETNSSKDLFIPALIFPVTEPNPEANDNRVNVVVPLTAEVYDTIDNRPMPLPVEPLMDVPTDLPTPEVSE